MAISYRTSLRSSIKEPIEVAMQKRDVKLAVVQNTKLFKLVEYNKNSNTEQKVTGQITRASSALLTLKFEVSVDCRELTWAVDSADQGFQRRDGLWQATCFELFLKSPVNSEKKYIEFNLTLKAWQCYAFLDYRKRDSNPKVQEPKLVHFAENVLEWQLDLNGLGIEEAKNIEVYPTAILQEQVSGVKSYWAMAHTEKQPDFHSFNYKGIVL